MKQQERFFYYDVYFVGIKKRQKKWQKEIHYDNERKSEEMQDTLLATNCYCIFFEYPLLKTSVLKG